MQAEASKLIHRLRFVGVRPVGYGGVMGAMPGNPNQADGPEAPSVRAGRFTMWHLRFIAEYTPERFIE